MAEVSIEMDEKAKMIQAEKEQEESGGASNTVAT
jgi:hypothetical protein